MLSAGNSPASTPAPSPRAPAAKPPQSPHKSSAGVLNAAVNTFMIFIGLVFTIAAFTWGIKSYQAAALSNQLSQRESCRMHPVRSQASVSPFPNKLQHDPMLQATPLCQDMREALDYDQLSKREAIDTVTKYLWSTRDRSIELKQPMSEQFSLLGATLRKCMIVCFDLFRALSSLVLHLLQAAWEQTKLFLKLSSIYKVYSTRSGMRAIESFNSAILSRIHMTSYRYIFMYIAVIAPFCLPMSWSKRKRLFSTICQCTLSMMAAELVSNIASIPVSAVALFWTFLMALCGMDALNTFLTVRLLSHTSICFLIFIASGFPDLEKLGC